MIANFPNVGILRFVTSAAAAQLTVGDTILRGNTTALFLTDQGSGSIDAQIDHTRAELGANAGFAIADHARATITDSIAARNTGAGFISTSAPTPARLFMERDTATGNGAGIEAQGGLAQAVVSNSTIVDNTTGLLLDAGGQLISRVNNTLTGNTTNGTFTGTLAAAYRAPRT